MLNSKKKMKLLLSLLVCFLPLFSSFAEESLSKEYANTCREEGYKLQSKGDYKGAQTYYGKAVQIDPVYFEAYNDLGVIYENLGDDDSALAMYKKALEISPDYLPACTNLAFLYEKKRDIRNARFYWEKRRDLGRQDDYWVKVADQHIENLLSYPEFRQERIEKDAGELAEKIKYEREQEQLRLIDEARSSFDTGNKLFLEEDYAGAVKELEKALSLNPPDEDLKGRIVEFLKQAKKLQFKKQALMMTEEALNNIRSEDFLTAAQKLKSAISEVARISPEK